nr:type IV secretion system protein [Mesorhizobium sp.]
MNDLGVIDRFMDTFIRYIDSGFGLLSGDVAFLTTILIGIDITLAGLTWAFGGEPNIFGRLIRKVLYVGVFAFILNNFKNLADSFIVLLPVSGLRRRPAICRQTISCARAALPRPVSKVLGQCLTKPVSSWASRKSSATH